LIKGDGLDGVSFTLAGHDHIAGRTEGPPLSQDDPFLSPRHANFYYKDGKLQVRDEVSANGIYVRIRQPTGLKSGDTFLIGEQILRIEATPPETAGLGPDEEGTYVFASPRRASRMRLVQLLRGGDVGLCVRATGEVVSMGRDNNDINFPDDPFIHARPPRQRSPRRRGLAPPRPGLQERTVPAHPSGPPARAGRLLLRGPAAAAGGDRGRGGRGNPAGPPAAGGGTRPRGECSEPSR